MNFDKKVLQKVENSIIVYSVRIAAKGEIYMKHITEFILMFSVLAVMCVIKLSADNNEVTESKSSTSYVVEETLTGEATDSNVLVADNN